MAKNEIIYFTKDGRTKSTNFNTGAAVTIYTAGADGSKILSIGLISAGGAGNITLYINDPNGAATNEKLSSFNTPANDDTLLSNYLPVDKNGNKYINLPPNAILKASRAGTGNSDIFVYGEDY